MGQHEMDVMTVATAGKIAIGGRNSMLAAIFAGVSGFSLADILTNKAWIAVVVSAIASIAVTYIKTKPRVIEVAAAADNQKSLQWQAATAELWERNNAIHTQQVQTLLNNTTTLIDRVGQRDKRIAALVLTKHALARENQSLIFRIRNHEELMAKHAVPFEPFHALNNPVESLLEEEDRIFAESVGLDINTQQFKAESERSQQ